MKRLFSIITLFSIFFFLIQNLHAQDTYGQGIESSRKKETSTEHSVKSFGSSENKDKKYLPQQQMMGTQSGDMPSITYTVHVLGEVDEPGTYKILPSSRLTDALLQAGNILPNGSERIIELKRDGESKTFDLFQYKYYADLNQNPYLMENDVIMVHAKKGEFQIEGPVNRPGVYEILGSMNLYQCVKMAGGFVSGLSKNVPIRIVRYDQSEKKQVLEVASDVKTMRNFKIVKGDVVVIPHILIADRNFDYNLQRIPGDNIFYPTIDDNVYVIGAVALPGAYEFKPHFSVKEYISLAGPTKDARLKSIKLLKHDGTKVKITSKTVIDPGDTLIVPQRYWSATTVVSWLSSISSLAISTLVIVNNF